MNLVRSTETRYEMTTVRNLKSHFTLKILLHRRARVSADLTGLSERRVQQVELNVYNAHTNLTNEVELTAEQAIQLGTKLIEAGEQMQVENAKAEQEAAERPREEPQKKPAVDLASILGGFSGRPPR